MSSSCVSDRGKTRLGGAVHKEIFSFPRAKTGPYKVKEWEKIVKPVIDLHDTVAVSSYEVPDRIATRVKLTRTTCTFPHCRRPAETTDLDHTIEYVPPDQGGPPGQTSTDNLAPLCRHDHRAKTHPSPAGKHWAVTGLTPGHWLWTSPHGHHYLVHPDGTTAL